MNPAIGEVIIGTITFGQTPAFHLITDQLPCAVAKRDYRDVLFWAENPEEAKLDTPEKRERIKKMFEQFGIKPPENLNL